MKTKKITLVLDSKTRDVKFNDGWSDYLVEIVETEATKDVILL